MADVISREPDIVACLELLEQLEDLEQVPAKWIFDRRVQELEKIDLGSLCPIDVNTLMICIRKTDGVRALARM